MRTFVEFNFVANVQIPVLDVATFAVANMNERLAGKLQVVRIRPDISMSDLDRT